MEKRVFLAIFLSFVVLAIYQAYFAPPPPKPGTEAAAAATTAKATPDKAGVSPASGPAAATASPTTPAESAVAPAPVDHARVLVGETTARDIVVDTEAVHAVFSTAGGVLKRWELKHYSEGGKPLEFVPVDVPASLPRAFTLSTTDDGISKVLATAIYRASADGLTLGTSPGTLSFEYQDASGLTARKVFHFQPDGKPYLLKVEASIDVNGAARPVRLTSGPAVGLGYAPDGSRSVPSRAIQMFAGKVKRLTTSALAKTSHYEGTPEFAGVEDQYFLNAALPAGQAIVVDYTPISLPVPNDTSDDQRTFVSYTLAVPGSMGLSYFMGPKDLDLLRAVNPQLVRAIDFGIFSWLVVPLLQALKWINGFVGNYGWSIAVLTVIINVLMFPLRHRSMVSMRKMQAIQPEVKAIQARYAKYKVTDPERQKMNAEMMGLYKQKGVNPVSGCLPMLFTMPVLYAVYAMLEAAIELRGAPWFGWIHDLSRHDPLYITPLLMGVSMLVQQKMMPSTADPMQQKIMLLMPIVFTVSFLWAPSGLVVYWLLSNVLAIGQQYVTNRMIAAPAPAVARARSKAVTRASAGRK
jgi:YidC/Oxa1 family membrane protein insertase